MPKVASERLEFRIRAELKERIEQAAELVQLPVGDFVRQAAEARAEEVIRSHAATVVPTDFFDQLLNALESPPVPNPALARHARRLRGAVASH